jgi:Cu2+-containing amine oxidase
MAAFGDRHQVTGAGWSVYWRIGAQQGGGLEVWFCDFLGRRVLYRGSAPFALVPYHRPVSQPPGPNHCYKDGFAPACGGAWFYALQHQAPNGWLGSGSFATVDTDAVVVDVHAATDFDPQVLSVTAKFQCGWYQYVHRWEFDSDGGIHASVAMGGELNPFARAVAHTHHFYFRLDFDIDGPLNDVVEMFHHTSFNPGGDVWQVISSQGKFVARPDTARKWRVRDTVSTNQLGLLRSYEIELPQTAGRDQFSTGDLWVTIFRGDSIQQGELIDCTDSALDTQYAVGPLDSINGNDIVVWAVIRSHHEPRNQGEEQFILPYHYQEFAITPRNFRP